MVGSFKPLFQTPNQRKVLLHHYQSKDEVMPMGAPMPFNPAGVCHPNAITSGNTSRSNVTLRRNTRFSTERRKKDLQRQRVP